MYAVCQGQNNKKTGYSYTVLLVTYMHGVIASAAQLRVPLDLASVLPDGKLGGAALCHVNTSDVLIIKVTCKAVVERMSQWLGQQGGEEACTARVPLQKGQGCASSARRCLRLR